MDWNDTIQSVTFSPEGHGALCVIHQLAIRTLAGSRLSAEDCVAFARRNEADFHRAALRKIAQKAIAKGHSLHISSRDVRRLPPSP
ncbi:hypothetical protein [Pararhizobium sp.]|uniref:hypothetical protein n=1 Tax=Pararhizobium sp. TaxID=1977563 RepID=UPI002722D0B7|nr:hypothetical protein [Pararhizobium sp.]MDO9416461.1 hypothetical protein [Pararhizobium sp.]